MANENEFNESDFLQAEEEFISAVRYMWEAGAEIEDIEKSLDNALEQLEDF